MSAFIFSAAAAAQQRFTAVLTAPQEVPPTNSTGKGFCSIVLNAAETEITVSCTYSGLSAPVVGSHIHDNGPVGVNGPVRFNFNFTGDTNGSIGPLTFAATPAQIADLRAKKWYANIHTVNFSGGEIRGQIKPSTQPYDSDGDARTDLKVFRGNAFYTLNSLTNDVSTNFFVGTSTVNSASDDYDGDGRADLVAFDNTGGVRLWRILQSATNTVREVQWGASTDQVLPADYDGDGKTDIAVFRRSTGIWYIIQSSDSQQRAEVFGAVNDIAVVGDFDKDGKNDLTTLRGTPDGVAWFTRRSSDGVVQTTLWGGSVPPASDVIFTAAQIDIDGDGIQDKMVVRDPNSGTTGDPVTFYILRSSDNQPFVLQWGIDTDTRIFGDYDGDGKTDIVSRRSINGQLVWYIYQSSTQSGRAVTFGATGDL